MFHTNNLPLLTSLVFLTVQSDLVWVMERFLSGLGTDFSTCDIKWINKFSNNPPPYPPPPTIPFTLPPCLPSHFPQPPYFSLPSTHPSLHHFPPPHPSHPLHPQSASVITSLICRPYLSHPQTLPLIPRPYLSSPDLTSHPRPY